MKKPTCHLCNSSKDFCIPIFKTYLCEECLDKITSITIDDEDYDKVKDSIKDVLRKNETIFS